MRKKIIMRKLKLILIFIIFFPLIANAFEVLGYIYRTDSISHLTSDIILRQNKSIQNNIKNINIISPQAYQVNKKGTVWGTVDPMILREAKQHAVKIMPLLTNANYNDKNTTQFLHNKKALEKTIREMIQVCKQKKLAGLQIDFEHIPLSDKNAFTQFYQNAAAAMHANHFLISVAIIPRITNNVPASDRNRSALEYWNGAYNYAALGKASDFVTLMAYDQHSAGTTPGSACTPAWLKKIIVYALKYIPASKISVGLPVHSSYWYTAVDKNLYVSESDLTYAQAEFLLKEHDAKIIWDKNVNVPYAIFSDNNLDRFLYLQNVATFKTQLAIIKKYHLRGISLWCLGYEDPNIWKVIATSIKNSTIKPVKNQHF